MSAIKYMCGGGGKVFCFCIIILKLQILSPLKSFILKKTWLSFSNFDLLKKKKAQINELDRYS